MGRVERPRSTGRDVITIASSLGLKSARTARGAVPTGTPRLTKGGQPYLRSSVSGWRLAVSENQNSDKIAAQGGMTFRSKAAAFGYPVRVFSSRSWPPNLNLIPLTWS
jgi:hypothetical protein